MKGSIGIPCADTARYTGFTDALANLHKPEGTAVRFAVCSWRHKGRNQLAQWCLDAGEDWLLMIDDDHVFPPDLLTRLLSHDVDVVAGLCLRKDEPYSPFVFESVTAGGKQALHLPDYQPGLVEVDAVGTGAMLIRRNVFEQTPEPWFTVKHDSGEDMLFCRKLRQHGFPVHCDLGAPVGHLTVSAVWPVYDDRGWHAGIQVSGETTFLRTIDRVFDPIEA